MSTETARDLTQTTLGVPFLVVLMGASIWIVQPSAPATIRAAMIVIATRPLMRRLQDLFGGRRVLAAAWLYWTGQTIAGTLLLTCTIPVGAMDNITRPVLIRKGVDPPLLLIMSGVIGGLIVFGLVGVFIGPVALAVAYKILADWVKQREAAQP